MKQHKDQLKTGVILNYVNMIIGNLIPIFYTPVMLQLLGQQEYGLYKLSSSVTSYLSLISLGIGAAVSRYLIKARVDKGKEEERRYLGLFILIFQFISLAALVVGSLITWKLDIWYGHSLSSAELGRMRILVFLMVCNTALNLSLSPYTSVVSSHEKFLFQQSVNIITTCLGPTFNLVALFLGFASVGMAVSSFLITLCCRVVYTLYVRKSLDMKPLYKNMPVQKLREILKFSFWVFLSTVVVQLYNTTDTILIGAVPALGTAAVAIYSIGGTFNTMVCSLTSSISAVMSPRANKMVFSGADNRQLTDMCIRVGRLQGYIITLGVSGFVAFGRPFIYYYAGPGYAEAYWVAVVMMVPNLIPLVQSMCHCVLQAKNKHQFRALCYLIIAILNVIGTWFALKVWGIIGAALVTGCALILGQGFAMNWYYHCRGGLNMFRFWKSIGKTYVIPLSMCALTLLLSKWIDFYSIPVWITGVILYVVIYSCLTWHFVLDDYEKNLIRVPLSTLKAKLSSHKKA